MTGQDPNATHGSPAVEDSFYVRIRGRVQGPYESERLRQLVKRGQLSRMHEVSTDKVTWVPAADYPDLFASRERVERQREPKGHEQTDADANQRGAITDTTRPDEKDWYYARNNVQHGPVGFEHLNMLGKTGALQPDDLVWKEGMAEWQPAAQVQGLVIAHPAGSEGPSTHNNSGTIDPQLLRTVSDSRPWSGFVSICVNTIGAMSAIFSLLAFLLGIRHGNVAETAGGLFLLIWSGVIITGGVLLSKYNRSAARFVAQESMTLLDQAMRSLRSLWVFLSIILLIFLVNMIGLFVWAIAAGLVTIG